MKGLFYLFEWQKRSSLPIWWNIAENTHLCMMSTLETEDVFYVIQMTQLANELLVHTCYERIIVLRIGGNDLMNIISLRRHRNFTLYDGPMGYVIKIPVAVFRARNFFFDYTRL